VPQRRSVVLGEFCAVLRLGLREVLAEHGCRVVADGARGRQLRTLARRADALLLDLDAPPSAAVAARLASAHPRLRVIGCSARRPAMCVYTAQGPGEERPLDAPGLVAAIGAPGVAA
jgi:hypothetical protein